MALDGPVGMSFSDFPLPPCSSRALSSASPPPRPTRATCLSYHVPLYPTDCNRRRTLGRLPSHSQIQPCVPFREIIDRSRKFEIYYRLTFLSCEYYLNYFVFILVQIMNVPLYVWFSIILLKNIFKSNCIQNMNVEILRFLFF